MEDKLEETFREAEIRFKQFEAEDVSKASHTLFIGFIEGLAKKHNLKLFSKKHKELLRKHILIEENANGFTVCKTLGELPKKIGTMHGLNTMLSAVSISTIRKHGNTYYALPHLNAPAMIFTGHFFDRYHQRYAKTSYSRSEVIKTFIRKDFFHEIPEVHLSENIKDIVKCTVAYNSGVGLGFYCDGMALMVTYVDNSNLSDYNVELKNKLEDSREDWTRSRQEECYMRFASY